MNPLLAVLSLIQPPAARWRILARLPGLLLAAALLVLMTFNVQAQAPGPASSPAPAPTSPPAARGAEAAGEVEFLRGVAFAQTPGQPPRAMGRGQQLRQGDRLTTAEGATAIIKLSDGTRMTLRPNSEMVMQQYQYSSQSAPDNAMVMQLLRGGFRSVTGLIAKSSPDAARIQTATATIGIRGTDFDARLCAQDCKSEASQINERPRPNAAIASAKLTQSQGEIHAVDNSGSRRRLVDGGSVYVGDRVETGASARGVLVFRDDSRLTLGPQTRFQVDNFVYDDKNAADGRFFVSLLGGSLRALTGLIGKANNRNVGFTTATATIGIRGTGLDLDCSSADACSFFTWLGSIAVTPQGQTALQVLQAGQGLFVSAAAIRPITAPTLESLPRPDTVRVDVQQLFPATGSGDKPAEGSSAPGAPQPAAAAPEVSVDEPGLFVYVRDGHIEVTSAAQTIHLGRGETGFAGSDGRTGRPAVTPLFIQFDRVPLPTSTNAAVLGVINQLNSRPANQCR